MPPDTWEQERAWEEIVRRLRELSLEDRMRVFDKFCLACGVEDPECSCARDE